MRNLVVKSSICAAVMSLSGLMSANAAVLVIGGGMARDCYVAVESKDSSVKALRVCDLALSQERLNNRDRAATFVNRGIVHMREGRFEMALHDYENSARLRPQLIDAQVNRGAALYGMMRYEEAMEALNRGVKAENDNARAVAYYNRGLTYEKLGNVEAAYYDFRTALEIEPEFELATRQLERFKVIPASD